MNEEDGQPMMSPTKINPKAIDEYLAYVNDERSVLEELRKTIRAVAPEGEECISYGLRAFRLNGHPLVAVRRLGESLRILSDEFRRHESVPRPIYGF
jgi:hypothetical protein